MAVVSAPSGIRTHTKRILRPLPLPIGISGHFSQQVGHWLARSFQLDSADLESPSLPGPGSLVRVTESARRVVIAEDEALIRLDLKEMLEEDGYAVVGEAGDGETAVKLATELRPDLV